MESRIRRFFIDQRALAYAIGLIGSEGKNWRAIFTFDQPHGFRVILGLYWQLRLHAVQLF